MAYEIFNTIEEVKAQVGGSINQSMEIDSIGPHIPMAANKHLILWIGPDLWAQLVTYVAASETPTDNSLNSLLPSVRKSLAFLTLEEYARIGSVQFGEAGLFRTENETHKSAYKYQENNYRQSMLENGYEALEMMLAFLESNSTDYPTWVTSSGYKRNKSLVINSAATFRNRYSRAISRHTFEMLRPLIEDMEWFTLYPIMGAAQYDDVKKKIADKATLTTEQTNLLELMQKAVAYFTVQEAIRRNQVQLKGNKIIQFEALEPQSSHKETPASTTAIKLAHRHNDEFGNRYISRIVKYLDANPTAFPLYATWKEEKLAAAETAATEAETDYERFP